MSQTVPAGVTALTMYVHADTTGRWREDRRSGDRDQPRMVRLAVMIRADDGRERVSVVVVAPKQSTIFEPDAVARHHIGREVASRIGHPIEEVMARLERMCDRMVGAESVLLRVAAFSQNFHRRVIQREAAALQIPHESSVQRLCLIKWDCVMLAAMPICALPRATGAGFRFPSLPAAYEHFVGEPLVLPDDPIESAHATLRAIQTIDAGIKAHRNERTTA